MTEANTELNLPPLGGPSTPEHGQILFALGQITAELKGLRDAKVIQNGRIEKLESRMTKGELWQSAQDGESKGISMTWYVISIVAGVLVGALGIYFTIKPH